MASHPEPLEDRRTPLSRERVLQAAVALADAEGIDALSMRRLAQELGVEAMSLYYHVANKADLLNAIVEVVVGEIRLPPADAEWKAAIRATAVSAHEILVRHPWSASLVLSGSGLSLGRLRYMEAILGSLRRGGFSAEMTDHAYHALDSHIMGFTLWQVGMDLGTEDDLRAMAGEFLAQLSVDEFPHLAEHIEQHLKPNDPDDVGEFEFGLGLILDGLERLLPEVAPADR
jgi:AcrR family transcriptional regulator